VSATAISSNFWKGAYPLVPGFIHAPSYYGQKKSNDNPADLIGAIIEGEGADSVAAVIAEPVQGAGGIVTPPPEYWPRLREICTKNDVLLIADEVMTGFARTGKMFALEHWKVVPDIMTVAKGITGGYFPFGATILSDKIFQTIKGTQFIHGLTYSGHPICAAAAVKAMQIYKTEDILSNVVDVGAHASERLGNEFRRLPCVGEVGGLGLFLTLEIVTEKEAGTRVAPEVMTDLQKKMLDAGLWIRFSHNRFHICPPLTTTISEMDRLLDIMKAAIEGLDQGRLVHHGENRAPTQ
jgi:adenosylmethionine-8-amino-7-oxononanoate aminotransferase